MHGHATGYVFYNWQSALKIQDSGEVGCMTPALAAQRPECCRRACTLAAVSMQATCCMVQVKLSYGSYPEFGAHTLQQIGQIVAREADR